jgi:hypothetical protein
MLKKETEMEKELRMNREKAREELQIALDEITAKEVSSLTKYDKGFLRSRVTYLKPEEKEKFKSILITQTKK